ncbi:MAG: MBL fold metallo-hydrolase, partial [Chloroflexi bacterium]|nr:MBL fold metallo-hydrolase [Chloroflexota bacterium]
MIECVLAPNPGPMTGTGTNTWLVPNGSGELAVIDPGPDDPAHIDAIVKAAEPLGRIRAVLVTHRHGDHLPAALPLSERTGAQLFGHADLPGVQRALADGETAFGTLKALQTPGHTPESVCYFDPTSGALFTGDLVAGVGTVVVDQLGPYMASLERLLTFEPRTIYPGHGPVVQDAIGKLQEYLDHRRQRERQVLAGLPATIDQLTAKIYTDVPSNLVPMAARNVSACL